MIFGNFQKILCRKVVNMTSPNEEKRIFNKNSGNKDPDQSLLSNRDLCLYFEIISSLKLGMIFLNVLVSFLSLTPDRDHGIHSCCQESWNYSCYYTNKNRD